MKTSHLEPLEAVLISTRIVISYAMKWGICCEFDGKSMKTKTAGSEFPTGRKAIVKQILASGEINKSKRAELIRVGKLNI